MIRTRLPIVQRSLVSLLALGGLAPGAAAAPSAADSLATLLDAAPSTPHVAMSCAPASTVLETLATAMSGAPEGALDPSGQHLVAALLAPGGIEKLGIDPDGALRLSLWEPTGQAVGELSLPFRGDTAAAESMMRELGMQPVVVPDTPNTWVSTDGDTETVARLDDGALILAFDGRAPEQTDLPPRDLPLVRGLPAEPGCAAWVASRRDGLPGPDQLMPEGGLAVVGFIPFQRDQLGLLRVRVGGRLPEALTTSQRAPVTGSSPEPPAVVLTLGLSAADLLQDPLVQDALELTPRQAKRALKYLNIASGTTVALFGNPRALDAVAMLPLDPTLGPTRPKKVRRRLGRLARKLDLELLRQTEQGMVLGTPRGMVHAEVREGRVVLAASGARALAAADGEGVPWVASSDLGWALDWPISGWTGPAMPGAGPFQLKVRGGVRADDDVLEIGVQVQTNAPPGLIGSFVTALLSQQVGGMARPQVAPADPLSEVERDLDGIAIAQELHFGAHGRYLELPPAPRRIQQLDANMVPWQADAAWERLGWAPDPPRTAAVYWVELVGNGYVVHAETDLDGDGVHAHFVRTGQEPMQRTSPAGIE